MGLRLTRLVQAESNGACSNCRGAAESRTLLGAKIRICERKTKYIWIFPSGSILERSSKLRRIFEITAYRRNNNVRYNIKTYQTMNNGASADAVRQSRSQGCQSARRRRHQLDPRRHRRRRLLKPTRRRRK